MTKSIKALEIKTSMLFKLDFADNSILSCFFFFFCLIIYLYFLIPVVTAQIFDYFAQLLIPIGIPIKEARHKLKHIQ